MKKVKFMSMLFLILIVFIFSGEFFQYYLNTYTSEFCYIDISEDEEYSQDEIQNKVFQIASKYGIDVFKTEKVNKQDGQFFIIVYGTKDVFDKLNNEYDIVTGSFDSFFSGKTEVGFADFKDKQMFSKTERYYFMGDNKQIKSFYDSLDFTRSLIKKETEHAYPQLILLIWVIIGTLFLILTWIDIHFQKKKIFVLISLGKNIYRIILKNILFDILVSFAIFTGLDILIGKYVYLGYDFKNIILIFITILLFNSLLYFTLLKLNYKEVLYGANLNERIVSDGYVLKSISMILVIAVLSCNVVLILSQFKELKKSKQLEYVKNYSFIDLKPISLLDCDEQYEETRNSLIYSIYNELLNKDYAYSFCGLTGEFEYCFLNSNSDFMLNNFNCNLKADKRVDFYILIPENFYNNQNVEQTAYDCIEMYYGAEEKINCKKIAYSCNVELLTYNNDDDEVALGTVSFKNPIVIYQNNNSMSFNCDKSELSILFGNMLFDLNENDINQISEKYFLAEKGLYLKQLKMNEKILSYQSVLNRALFLNTVISIFLLLLELFIISVIIKLEYKVSATELAIKKVLGYSIFKKNKQIFLLNIYSTFISVISCVILSLMYKISVWYIVIAVGISIICLEYSVIATIIVHFENQNVAKILKGGCL